MIKTIYHGSSQIVQSPKFGVGYPYNDYGLGFYCTDNKELAEEWAITGSGRGFVNRYSIDTSGLRIIDLTSPEYSIRHWLSVMLSFREFDIHSSLFHQELERIRTEYNVDYSNCDILIGYRGDNCNFTFAESFLRGEIDATALRQALTVGDSAASKQFVIKSNRAFDRLVFEDWSTMGGAELRSGRFARDRRLMQGFAKNTHSLAYTDIYREKAERVLGEMLDYAAYSLHQNPAIFFELFLASGVAEIFEAWDTVSLAGISGVELAYAVMERSGLSYTRIRPRFTNSRSKELLCGEVLAHYQWQTALSFSDIVRACSIADIITSCDERLRERRRLLSEVFPPRMETLSSEELAQKRAIERLEDIQAISEHIDHVINSVNSATVSTNEKSMLQRLRIASGFSQSELARSSGVPLRTIQQYEQGQKDLSHAQLDTVLRLARALTCNPRDLI